MQCKASHLHEVLFLRVDDSVGASVEGIGGNELPLLVVVLVNLEKGHSLESVLGVAECGAESWERGKEGRAVAEERL